jgi:hypothetical protein
MSLFVCWFVFPLVMLAVTLGCGLLAEWAGGARLPAVLLAPVGLAVVVVIAGFFTLADATAELATPAVVAAAVAGLILGRNRLRARPDWPAALAATGAYLAYGAPIIATGQATFAGYIKLDDTSTWLALTDRAMEHGRSMAGLAPSTYEATLGAYLNTGYPLGSFLPWGVGHSLVGQDLLWVFQPYEAFLCALLALAVYSMLRPLLERAWLAGAAAFVAAQPALLYGYSLWGGVKEVMAATLIATVAALAGWSIRGGPGALRRPVALAAASAAVLISLSVGGGAWIAVALAATAIIVAVGARSNRAALLPAAAFLVIGAILAIPAFVTASRFVKGAAGLEAKSVAGTAEALGNLLRPLKIWQIVGIWPSGDFRIDPISKPATVFLVELAIGAAVLGLVLALRRREFGLPLYVATTLAGCAIFAHYGSPWIDGKALATSSPVVFAAAMAGAAMLLDRGLGGRRGGLIAAGGAAFAALALGVVWSNALAYHDVNIAPRDQLRELEYIGNRFAGDSPALITDYQTYGARHFLRKLDAEGASELRRRVVPLRASPQGVNKGGFADIDEFAPGALDPYRTLVILKSPTASRPSSVFDLVWSGDTYEVWQRRPKAARVVEHVPLGNSVSPSGTADCEIVRRLAREAGPGGKLATVFRTPVYAVALANFTHPARWATSGTELYPKTHGTGVGAIDVTVPGRYDVWVGGSFRSRLEVWIDGRRAGALRDVLNHAGGYARFGSLDLGSGRHRVELRYAGPDLAPGSAAQAYPMGPLVLAQQTAPGDVTYLDPKDARSLCGKRLDWLEALGPA